MMTRHKIAGLAVSSGRSLFLSGPPGNGKTSTGRIFTLPFTAISGFTHAIAVANNTSSVCSTRIAIKSLLTPREKPIHRPTLDKNSPAFFIVAGGEMTLESLSDMAYLPAQKYYEAPLHTQSNNGGGHF